MEESIFISYSHKDTETVNAIVSVIKKATKMNVWYDTSLRGGENYFSAIANQIIKSKFFVFIVSDNSIESEWCLRELEFAASERKRIIAVWLDRVSIAPRVKLVIQNTHYIYYYSASNESFFDTISKAFQDNSPIQTTGLYADDEFKDLVWKDTYFLDSERLKRIDNLLSLEKKGKYSVCFKPENACLLGLAYELGINVEADLYRAEFYYKISDYKGNYDGKYLYAAIRSKKADADKASLLAEMIDAAEHKSVCALTYLGEDYYYGRNGCDTDKEKAYAFWKQAADDGGIVAMYYLAFGYRNGECVKKDVDLAYMYALMATEYGFPRAYRLLAFLYEEGEMCNRDTNKAIAMYEEAIKRGDLLSLCYEGNLYGETKDYGKQLELYEKAIGFAESGDIHSGYPYYLMGYSYKYGEGVSRDIIKAVDYYIKGAERKNGSSLRNAVSAIMQIEDKEQREHYLHKAFDCGCKDAAYRLGEIEESKTDSNRLSKEAVNYYTEGAKNGDLYCVDKLLRNYSFVIGSGEDRSDRLEAIKWFQFFFAHADEEYLKSYRDRNILSTYYYAYAIELDYDPEYNLPDREFVQLYFRKSLDESPEHFRRILGFVVDGYLFPEDSSSGLKLDVLHAAEMLELLETYLDGYWEYLKTNEASEAKQTWADIKKLFTKGYNKIGECYGRGKSIELSFTESLNYRNRASQIEKRIKKLASDNPI